MNTLDTPAKLIDGLTLERVQDLARRCGYGSWTNAITCLNLGDEPWICVESVLEDQLAGEGRGAPHNRRLDDVILRIMVLSEPDKRALWDWMLDTRPFQNQLRVDLHG